MESKTIAIIIGIIVLGSIFEDVEKGKMRY